MTIAIIYFCIFIIHNNNNNNNNHTNYFSFKDNKDRCTSRCQCIKTQVFRRGHGFQTFITNCIRVGFWKTALINISDRTIFIGRRYSSFTKQMTICKSQKDHDKGHHYPFIKNVSAPGCSRQQRVAGLRHLVMSFIKSKNQVGPNPEPWGTSEVTGVTTWNRVIWLIFVVQLLRH